jgi:hypothetical protein
MKSYLFLIPVRCLLLIFTCMMHTPESSGQYQIKAGVVGGGGGVTEGSSFNVLSTVGQTVVGNLGSFSSQMFLGMWYQHDIVTSVEKIEDPVPLAYRLEQNYPNPFNPTTTIRFSIPDRRHVRLSVYDLLGREVTRFIDEEMEAGWYSVVYDAAGLASGVYVYRIEADSFNITKRFILLK